MNLLLLGVAAGIVTWFIADGLIRWLTNRGLGDEDEADRAVRNQFSWRPVSEARTMPLKRLGYASALDLLALQKAAPHRDPYPRRVGTK
ncbi:hypothetical protein [Nocardia terpenica]|uniref:hypothetical protein n=1 Tax=Nocardia terpenica TaxID=455432 RepID=UPI000B112D4E|nr:hypothetical protein [Nocardia terpenica]NQE89804.1 hypothetical protein [Nocardia terpenica]